MADLSGLKAEMDAGNLFEEKIISDRKVGTIRVLTPVKADGTADASRTPVFMGEVQIMTHMGALPISFEIKAGTLAEAVASYGEAAKQGVEDTLKRLEDLREQAAHRIVTPGTEGFQVPPQGGSGISGSGLVGL
ncbi:hypothetical protein MAF45_02365 [Mesosutterella sp. OilRF-GAM-744-9]|nr:hypothetical protein [Mesosutterella sp. oilRF-744-WT-GAM-9]MCG5030301.1 hypothetical protein [Mesosutterella sp. oilRF-744-WT-GAM-9]